jgi:hypothetical protein
VKRREFIAAARPVVARGQQGERQNQNFSKSPACLRIPLADFSA